MPRTSGRLPLRDGLLTATGLLGQDLDVATGQLAARWCAAGVLAQAKRRLSRPWPSPPYTADSGLVCA
ncbi:hypothetical protein [Streptomyces oryzae]|uniref:hypothetical protein n=1 Tax=Streptomyces oryzae TaxID=1434886 RepID=UPI003556243A